MNNNYLQKVKDVIHEKIGIEPGEVSEEMFIEEDLNISEMELLDILEELEDTYHIELIEDKGDIESVGDIVDILTEKLE